MDSIGRLKYQLAFDFLAPSIEGQRKMDSSYRAHIETATGLLEEVAGGLESMAVSKGGFGWWNPEDVERAKEVLALQGYDISHLSRKQIAEHAKNFRDKIKLFEKLAEDSEIIYERFFDRIRLFHLCEDFKKFYAENYQVMKCQEDGFQNGTAD